MVLGNSTRRTSQGTAAKADRGRSKGQGIRKRSGSKVSSSTKVPKKDDYRSTVSRVKKEASNTATTASAISNMVTSQGNRVKRGTVAYQKNYTRPNWAKRLVWVGKKVKTSGGLFKRNLMCNKKGKIVSKKLSAQGSRRFRENHIDLWMEAFMQIRAEKSLRGFVKCKKAGTWQERRLMEETQARWQDAVATRVVQMVQREPALVGKINQKLAVHGTIGLVPGAVAAAAAAASSPAAAAARASALAALHQGAASVKAERRS